MVALVELDRVSRNFGGVMAVNDVSLAVAEGEIVGLIGPNGAGKTTLFNLIAGAQRPSAGRVLLRGADITALPPHERCKRGVARTFQLAQPFADMTVLENVAVGRVYGRDRVWHNGQARADALDLLDYVGLAGRAHDSAEHLTPVEVKRLDLARALATRPSLLLLDELLAGLNPTEVRDALDLIRRIRSTGITMIIVEHIVSAVLGVSDRVIVLNSGRQVASGAPAALLHDATVQQIYLGYRTPQ